MAFETGPVNMMDTQVIDVDLEPPTPSAKMKKLRALWESAERMSKMRDFPDKVRKNFVDKADLYAEQLKKLEKLENPKK
jgi:hypothetical protein